MAEQNVTQEEQERLVSALVETLGDKVGLADALPELSTLHRYVTECEVEELTLGSAARPDPEILLVLINGLMEKIYYFTRKYKLDVAREEQVETLDLIEFVRERCKPFTGKEELRAYWGLKETSEKEG